MYLDEGNGTAPAALHCTKRLITGLRIHLGGAPHACAFDPIYDELFCGTAAGEIVRVSPEQGRVVERWRVTHGEVGPRTCV